LCGPTSQAPALSSDLTLPEAVAELERVMIRRALAEAGGSRTDAARKLGIHRQLLYDKMKRHGLGEISGEGK
jgi:two-component system NtrC family response regulator